MLQQQPLLHLDPGLLIGSGGVRDVYRHPHDKDRCIKIIHNLKRQRSARRETRYLRKYERQGKPFERLTRFHGWCDTNLGAGAIFDLIRDHDGRCSQTLSSHVAAKADPCLSPHEIVEQLIALYRHLLEHNIIVCDPAPHNLVVHYYLPGSARLVIIDGIANPHFIKIADYSTRYSHRLIKKKWWKYMEQNPIMQDVFRLTGYTAMENISSR